MLTQWGREVVGFATWNVPKESPGEGLGGGCRPWPRAPMTAWTWWGGAHRRFRTGGCTFAGFDLTECPLRTRSLLGRGLKTSTALSQALPLLASLLESASRPR